MKVLTLTIGEMNSDKMAIVIYLIIGDREYYMIKTFDFVKVYNFTIAVI